MLPAAPTRTRHTTVGAYRVWCARAWCAIRLQVVGRVHKGTELLEQVSERDGACAGVGGGR